MDLLKSKVEYLTIRNHSAIHYTKVLSNEAMNVSTSYRHRTLVLHLSQRYRDIPSSRDTICGKCLLEKPYGLCKLFWIPFYCLISFYTHNRREPIKLISLINVVTEPNTIFALKILLGSFVTRSQYLMGRLLYKNVGSIRNFSFTMSQNYTVSHVLNAVVILI